ncbi:MAG: cyanophycinase [Phycisphaerae bacterium]|nr:cyanophycinase [Gemmatimonadaceae bacterium]
MQPDRSNTRTTPRVLTALLLLTLASWPAVAQSGKHGPLFIVGGGTQPKALVQEFVNRAAARQPAHIIVFAMASASGLTSGEAKAEDFRKLGAHARNVWVTREQADLDSVVRLLDSATGVWFGGGDQNRLIRALRGSKLEKAIYARHAAGAVVGGTSAGAAVISTMMITGTELLPGRDTSEAWTRVKRATVQTDTGFTFLPDAIIDQHFLKRKRQNRLLSLVLADAPHLGAGIDEGTALVVESNGLWRIMGASAVLIVDARDAARTSATDTVLGASGVRMHLLPDGATFDPKSGKATLQASRK